MLKQALKDVIAAGDNYDSVKTQLNAIVSSGSFGVRLYWFALLQVLCAEIQAVIEQHVEDFTKALMNMTS